MITVKQFFLQQSLLSVYSEKVSPPPHDAQAQALARVFVELHREGVPQVFLLVLGLIPVDRQPNLRWCLTEDVDGFIVAGRAQINAIHL